MEETGRQQRRRLTAKQRLPVEEMGKRRLPMETGATTLEDTLIDILGLGAGITSVQYDSVVTAPGADEVTIHVWLEGDRMRTDSEITGGETVVTLIDVGAGTMYLYYPAMNMAMEVPFDPEAAESPLAESQSIPDYDYEIIGIETMSGMECLRVEYTSGQATVKMWIWTEYGFPIRTEVTISGSTTIAECQNIEFKDIEDSMFELPAGVTIVEL